MSVSSPGGAEALTWLLLAFAALVLLACGLGVLLMDNAMDRLHFLGPAVILAPLAIAAAIWLRHGLGQDSVKATLVLLIMLFTAPVLSHVTARATLPPDAEPDPSSGPGLERAP